ncbi:MAG: arsenite methyltransferase [Thermomicrobiales bacterium]
MSAPSPETVRESVQKKYSDAARLVLEGQPAACCGPAGCGCGSDGVSPIVIGNYDPEATSALPEDAVLASLGCGNPTALAQLEPGQTVLDLGSGGGIDVLLSARRVGPTGFAYGLDMTDEMLQLAERNKQEAGVGNVEFLKGEIENIPLPDNTVDVIISNCVINLSADKPAVFREAFRVLKPGGYMAVSDIVVQGELPEQIRTDMESWAGCVAGALREDEYLGGLVKAGFVDASVEVTQIYDVEGVLGPEAAAATAGVDASSAASSGRPSRRSDEDDRATPGRRRGDPDAAAGRCQPGTLPYSPDSEGTRRVPVRPDR